MVHVWSEATLGLHPFQPNSTLLFKLAPHLIVVDLPSSHALQQHHLQHGWGGGAPAGPSAPTRAAGPLGAGPSLPGTGVAGLPLPPGAAAAAGPSGAAAGGVSGAMRRPGILTAAPLMIPAMLPTAAGPAGLSAAAAAGPSGAVGDTSSAGQRPAKRARTGPTQVAGAAAGAAAGGALLQAVSSAAGAAAPAVAGPSGLVAATGCAGGAGSPQARQQPLTRAEHAQLVRLLGGQAAVDLVVTAGTDMQGLLSDLMAGGSPLHQQPSAGQGLQPSHQLLPADPSVVQQGQQQQGQMPQRRQQGQPHRAASAMVPVVELLDSSSDDDERGGGQAGRSSRAKLSTRGPRALKDRTNVRVGVAGLPTTAPAGAAVADGPAGIVVDSEVMIVGVKHAASSPGGTEARTTTSVGRSRQAKQAGQQGPVGGAPPAPGAANPSGMKRLPQGVRRDERGAICISDSDDEEEGGSSGQKPGRSGQRAPAGTGGPAAAAVQASAPQLPAAQAPATAPQVPPQSVQASQAAGAVAPQNGAKRRRQQQQPQPTVGAAAAAVPGLGGDVQGSAQGSAVPSPLEHLVQVGAHS